MMRATSARPTQGAPSGRFRGPRLAATGSTTRVPAGLPLQHLPLGELLGPCALQDRLSLSPERPRDARGALTTTCGRSQPIPKKSRDAKWGRSTTEALKWQLDLARHHGLGGDRANPAGDTLYPPETSTLRQMTPAPTTKRTTNGKTQRTPGAADAATATVGSTARAVTPFAPVHVS